MKTETLPLRVYRLLMITRIKQHTCTYTHGCLGIACCEQTRLGSEDDLYFKFFLFLRDIDDTHLSIFWLFVNLWLHLAAKFDSIQYKKQYSPQTNNTTCNKQTLLWPIPIILPKHIYNSNHSQSNTTQKINHNNLHSNPNLTHGFTHSTLFISWIQSSQTRKKKKKYQQNVLFKPSTKQNNYKNQNKPFN